jgi:steroid 5-alpha reductase family enzyme
MFLSPICSLTLHQERYKDLLREAERYRLVQQALAGRERHPPFYYRALTWLGGRLVAWGWHLQERYGATTAAPALWASNRTR